MQRIAQRSALGLCLAACIGAASSRAGIVLAQPGAASTPPATEATTAPRVPARAPPSAAPIAPAAPAAPVRSSAACIAGASEGIPRGDVHTAAALVCQALRDTGADVSAEPVDAEAAGDRSSAYRVDVRPLGSLVFMQVIFESPIGTPVQSRSLQLNGIEEVSVAAPRIADSIVHGTPLANTAKVATLVGEETRVYAKKYGETMFAFGILGYALPNETWAGYGVFGRLYYEAERYAVGLDLRLATSGASDGDSSLIGVSVGGRYFLNEDDISPFAGGGAGILWIGQKRTYASTPMPSSAYYPDEGGRTQLRGSGLVAFGEVGVEFLRMHKTRLDAFLRADAPFFDLEGGGHHRYTVPISIQVSYSFN
jgi:hypothetical protein